MNQRNTLPITQSAALVGFAVSAFLLAQYLLPPSAGGCPIGGGCHVVRACQLLVPAPVWPMLGTAGFLLVLLLSLPSAPWAQRTLRLVSIPGALIGLGLLAAQGSVCGAFCPYCLATDAAALIVAVAAWMQRGEPEPSPEPSKGRWVFAGLAAVAAAGAASWYVQASGAENKPSRLAQLPAAIARDQQPGTVTLVEFMDFACPHCIEFNPELSRLVEAPGSRVRLVRRFPRPSSPGAAQMARAFICAEAQGKAEPMAKLLFSVLDGRRPTLEGHATQLGLDVPAFSKCYEAPETAARLAEDQAIGQEAQVLMLPTLFVGKERYDGATTAASLKASIERGLNPMEAAGPLP
jgi:protein-disulfide isomerase